MADPKGLESENALPASPDHTRPEVERVPWLVVVEAGAGSSALLGEIFPLSVSPFVIGRDSNSNVVCATERVSRHHASVVCDEHGWRIHDASSINGTFVNGKRSAEANLATGDRIQVGDVVFKFIGAGDLEGKFRARTGRVDQGRVVEAPATLDPNLVDTNLGTGACVRIEDVVFKFVESRDPNWPPETFEDYMHATQDARREDARRTRHPPEATSERTTAHEQVPDPAHSVDVVSESPGRSPARSVDYKGADLRKADLRKFDLAGADFTGADLTAANLSGSDLTGANFAGANLSSLPETLPGEQHFFPPWGRLTDLGRANLAGANFSGANLYGVNLTGAYLGGANLTGANLTRAELYGANFKGANLTRANLTFAMLEGANLTGANLNESTLNDANLRFADLQSAQLRGARLKRADLGYVNFERADLGGSDLTGSYLARANLRDAYLSGARLRNCHLFAASLGDADLRRADARNAIFDRAWLVGADLEFADLRGATFSKSWLLGTNLQGTKTSGSALQDARCSPTTAFPTHLHYLRRAQTLFSVNKAGAWARFRGTEYGVRENATAYRPVVVLRCVGEVTSATSYNGLQLLPFTQLISEWTALLTQMDVFSNDIPPRILLIDGFETSESGHCAVFAIGVSAPTMPILAAILKASRPIPRTRDELLDRAERARVSVTLMLQRLAPFLAKDASRLSESTPSSFFAGCIDAIWKLRFRGGDVVLMDPVGNEGPDAAAKIIRELRESI